MSAGLQRVDIGARPPADYAPVCGSEAVDQIESAAADSRKKRVLHVSVAGGGGGGVPDQLSALLPLMAGAGLQVEWRVLFGPQELQSVCEGLREGMQGAESAISDDAWQGYLDGCAAAAATLPTDERYDAVVLHDPGALGLVGAFESRRTVWRCHVDASRPDGPAWDRLAPLADRCEMVVFGDASFAPEGRTGSRARAVAPGIDPLSPRNAELPHGMASAVLRGVGVDLDRPLCSQLMRLDRWKDPHAALDAFALAREEIPLLQFVIACEMDTGGEGWPAVKEISEYAGGQEGLHLITSYSGNLGNVELSALNQLSRVAVRLSLREGFGLASSEALWRGTPVVGGREGGTPLQVREGIQGYLVDDPEQAAGRIVELVRDPGLAVEMGRAGKEHVRENFLITRALRDELRLLSSLG